METEKSGGLGLCNSLVSAHGRYLPQLPLALHLRISTIDPHLDYQRPLHYDPHSASCTTYKRPTTVVRSAQRCASAGEPSSSISRGDPVIGEGCMPYLA